MQLKKLQCVQNTATRIVTQTRKFDHITPVLFNLHWFNSNNNNNNNNANIYIG